MSTLFDGYIHIYPAIVFGIKADTITRSGCKERTLHKSVPPAAARNAYVGASYKGVLIVHNLHHQRDVSLFVGNGKENIIESDGQLLGSLGRFEESLGILHIAQCILGDTI